MGDPQILCKMLPQALSQWYRLQAAQCKLKELN